MHNQAIIYVDQKNFKKSLHILEESASRYIDLERALPLITIFVNLGFFWHFETVTNIIIWIK